MRNLLVLISLLPTLALAAEVYRWVDEDGSVHYSDRPQEGAETVELQEAQTFSAPKTASSSRKTTDDSEGKDDETSAAYTRFELVSPQQDEVFWNTGGTLNVSWRTAPRLQTGHSLYLFLDGQEAQQAGRGQTRAQLTEVSRGTHSLYGEIRDRSGASVARTGAVTFTVQQTSIQNPNNPNRPTPTPLPSAR